MEAVDVVNKTLQQCKSLQKFEKVCMKILVMVSVVVTWMEQVNGTRAPVEKDIRLHVNAM